MRIDRREWLAGLGAMLCCMPRRATAQMLAHPGWRGNGITHQPWWKSAVVYRAAASEMAAGDDAALDARMDAIRALGVDAVWVFQAADVQALEPVLQRAGARRLRVMVDLDREVTSGDASVLERLNFWLVRGVAGLYSEVAWPAPMQARMRATARRFAGERVLYGPAFLPLARVELRGGEMAAMGEAVEKLLPSAPVALCVQEENKAQWAWVAQAVSLRRSVDVQGGTVVKTDDPQARVMLWPRASRAGGAVVLARNLSGTPRVLRLRAQVNGMDVRGSFLRPLLRNDGGMGGMNLDEVRLPAFGVFVGEVRS